MLARGIFIDDPPDPPRREAPAPSDDPVIGCVTREDGYDDLRMSDLARNVDMYEGAKFYKDGPDGSIIETAPPSWLEDERALVAKWRGETGGNTSS